MNGTIGVIGLGNMGSSIALNLSEAFPVVGFDIDEQKRSSLETQGIQCVSELGELAKQTEVILISLPNGAISKAVIEQMITFLGTNHIIIETSTVLPTDIYELKKIGDTKGVKVVDAAILGGITHILEAKADFLVGGEQETIDYIEPILRKLGKKVNYMGKLGSGMSAKVINNAVAHTSMVLIVEAAAIGRKLGISHEKMFELLSGETTYERPVKHRFNERIANEAYAGGMSTSNARKDSTLALELAQQLNIPLFSIQASHTVYELAQNEGYGDLDYASIAKLWEKWCQIQLSREH